MVFGVMGLIAAPAVQLEGWFGVSLVGTDLITILSLVGMACLLYTSDAADDMQCVDLGGRRIIKKKKRA